MAPSMPRFTAGKGGGKARTRVGSCQEKGMQERENGSGEGRWGEIPGEKVLRGRAQESLGEKIILSASFCCRASQGTCTWPVMAQQDNFLWLLWHFLCLGMTPTSTLSSWEWGMEGVTSLSLSLGCFPELCPTSSKGAFAKYINLWM